MFRIGRYLQAPSVGRRLFCNTIRVRNSLLSGDIKINNDGGETLNWYACGPTVYDVAHIGHARTYICTDIIHRILTKVLNVNVNYVMGLTDIDDKIVNKAIDRGYQNWDDVRVMTDGYAADFFRDLNDMNVTPPNTVLKVTNHISDIIRYVETIISNGYAYVVPDSGVYFDIGRFTQDGYTYGKLGGVNQHDVDTQSPGIPEEEEEIGQRRMLKRDPRDFALWKCVPAGSLTFDSPWGAGRPGWHIECSAVTHAMFGPEVAIHSGGIDLLFPHHTNEIAQCEAHNRRHGWVRHWMHMGHLYINGRKMSKSLKNFITMEEFLHSNSTVMSSLAAESGTAPNAGVDSPCPAIDLRLCFLLYKYHAAIHFSSDVFRQAVQYRARVEDFGFLVQKAEASARGTGSVGDFGFLVQKAEASARGTGSVECGAAGPRDRYRHSNVLLLQLADCQREVLEAFRDDFDTPSALHRMSTLMQQAGHYASDIIIKGGYRSPEDPHCPCPPVEPLHSVRAYVLHTLAQLGVVLESEPNVKAGSAVGVVGGNQTQVALTSFAEELVKFRSRVRALSVEGLQRGKTKKGSPGTETGVNAETEVAAGAMQATLKELLVECDQLRDQVAADRLGLEITDVSSSTASWRFK